MIRKHDIRDVTWGRLVASYRHCGGNLLPPSSEQKEKEWVSIDMKVNQIIFYVKRITFLHRPYALI
jgi:hypothetical protein